MATVVATTDDHEDSIGFRISISAPRVLHPPSAQADIHCHCLYYALLRARQTHLYTLECLDLLVPFPGARCLFSLIFPSH